MQFAGPSMKAAQGKQPGLHILADDGLSAGVLVLAAHHALQGLDLGWDFAVFCPCPCTASKGLYFRHHATMPPCHCKKAFAWTPLK